MGRSKGSRKNGKKWAAAGILSGAILAGVLLFQEIPQGPPAASTPEPGTLRVHYVNVGQGDGVAWELPDGSLVVYDCGDVPRSGAENPMVAYLRDVLQRPENSTIHALVASHGHRDHVGGCDGVFQRYRVAHVYEAWYEGADRPQSYQRFLSLARQEGAQIHALRPVNETDGETVAARWDAIMLPNASGVAATLFWPPFVANDWDRIAETSLGVRLVHGDVSFCFQGDIETSQERQLANEDAARDLSCDVYLVGHHGSAEASSAAWLDRMSPRVAVASFGQNSYGHPRADSMCRIQTEGAKLYFTHRLGHVVVETDGASLTVTPDAPETADYCAAGASYTFA